MKPFPLWREIGIWLLVGFSVWGIAHQGQQSIAKNPTQSRELRIQVPKWIALLCGRPSSDNQVEVGRMVTQLCAFVISFLWIPLLILGVEFQIRMKIAGQSFVIAILLGFIVGIIGIWWAKQ
jgi:hypothetical protein